MVRSVMKLQPYFKAGFDYLIRGKLMNLVKFVPTMAAALVLVACSTENSMSSTKQEAPMKETSTMMKSAQPTFETAAYFCDVKGKRNKVVSATYAFVNGKIDTATVTVDGVVVGHEMKLDPSYQDGTQFVEGKKVWSLESGFTQATASKTVPIMFTSDNRILAKNCEVAK